METWDFEDSGDLGFTQGSSGFAQDAAAAHSGSFGLRYTGGATYGARYTTTDYAASGAYHLEGWVRNSTSTTSLAGFLFGGQASTTGGYQVLIDNRNPTTDGFQLRKDNAVVASNNSMTLVDDDWYRIAIDWTTSAPQISAKLYDSAGVEVGTLQHTDSTYSTGRVGAFGFGDDSHFDDVTLVTTSDGVTLTATLPAVVDSLTLRAYTTTDTTNGRSGRIRGGYAIHADNTDPVILPAAAATRHDKALWYPEPDLLDGRPVGPAPEPEPEPSAVIPLTIPFTIGDPDGV